MKWRGFEYDYHCLIPTNDNRRKKILSNISILSHGGLNFLALVDNLSDYSVHILGEIPMYNIQQIADAVQKCL